MGKTRQVANLVSDNNIFVDVNADRVGIGTINASSKLTVSGDVSVSGVLTATSYGGTIANATNSTNVSGGIASVSRLQVAGVSTFTGGPVLIGSGTSTGTASQPLQVTGGAYVSGNLGVGNTNSSDKLHVGGNIRIDSGSGALTFWSGAGFYGGIGVANAFGGSGTDINVRSDNSRSIIFQTGGANDRGRIDSNGIFLVGTATSTGTSSQRLQVTGGAYVSGSVGIGTTNPSNTLTVVGTTDIQGAVETVSVASTYNLPSGRVILECNAQSGTVFTHNLANGSVGIVSLRNFPATKNSITTFTILFTQNSTGTANTTPATGIGTNIQLWPTGSSSGLTTSSRVSTASTITLPTTANDIDIVTFAVHYNGAGAATTTNYTVYGSDVSSFRFGNIRP
jgi:hypothetical protein